MNFLNKIAETDYVRSAIEDKADLSGFERKPAVRVFLGVAVMGLSYIIGWPAIGALGALSVFWDKPLLVAIGGPVLYGLSHVTFLLGMYLAGEKYTKMVLRWATRIAMEKLLR